MPLPSGSGFIRWPAESKRLYDALTCPKTLMVFDETTLEELRALGYLE